MKDFNEYYEIVLTKGWNDLSLDFDYDPTLKEFLSHRSSGRFWGTKHPVPQIEITEQVKTKKDSHEDTSMNEKNIKIVSDEVRLLTDCAEAKMAVDFLRSESYGSRITRSAKN